MGVSTVECTAVDSSGNEGLATFTVTVEAATPVSPAEAIAQLQTDIENLVSDIAGIMGPKGIRTALTVKLDSALAALEQGKNGLAISKLNTFINFVNVMDGKKFATDQEVDVRDDANAIILAIGAL